MTTDIERAVSHIEAARDAGIELILDTDVRVLVAAAEAGRVLAHEVCALMSLDVVLNHGKHSDSRWQRLGDAWRAYAAATTPMDDAS